MEYGFGTDPASGIPVVRGMPTQRSGLQLSAQTSGAVNAVLWKPANTSGLAYQLEKSSDFLNWTSVAAPVVSSQGNGGELLTWEAVDAGASAGFVRIKITLDGSATSVGQPVGWSKVGFAVGTQSYGLCLLPDTLFVGTAKSVNGSTLLVQDSEAGDLRALFVPGRPVYLEFTQGLGEGQRIDVITAQCTANTIALDLSSPYNTTASYPASMTGARFVLRHHEVLGDVFPKESFSGAPDELNADAVVRYSGSVAATYWLLDTRAQPGGGLFQWTLSGDVTQADQAGLRLKPGEGVFVQRRSPPDLTMVDTGEIRPWKQRRTLQSGVHFVAGSYPVDQSPDSLGMTGARGFISTNSSSRSDRVQVWSGDAVPGGTSYVSYWYFAGSVNLPGPYWTRVGDASLGNVSGAALFPAGRGHFLQLIAGVDYLLPLPPGVGAFPAPGNSFMDSDDDGLSDLWEMQYFGNLGQSSGSADADNDGITNAEEFLLGTNPAVVATVSTAPGLIVATPLE